MVTPSQAESSLVLERLERLYEIGGGPGANRPGLSRAEQQACELVAVWMEEGGLAVEWDPAGNLVGRLAGTEPAALQVWTGSHLDTVPSGGRFDGALGVVAGLAAVERMRGEGLRRTLAVVAFRDEEGWRFPGRGFFGSRALCGLLGERELGDEDGEGTSIREALAALGIAPPPPEGWSEQLPGAYVEAHVEQGPVLERAGIPLGLVTGIAGTAGGSATFFGRENHAGTTPMAERRDALCLAAEFVLAVRDAATSVEGAVATVGAVRAEPGAANVIPGRATVTIDARAPDRARLDAVVERIRAAAGDASLELRDHDPIPMAAGPRQALGAEMKRLGLPLFELHSGGGHDAGILASAGVATGMVFVRSLAGGVSHSPDETASGEDVALCVDVLAGALRRLAG